ncbi:polysaccharide pyruvyl transferase family protein [Leeuwenhoekiella sp. LLG6367-2.1]|uniref:polysaccharide pyruvyl transferase family protein n=1 Tax=Leeuwenhoekiella sp. LLG6367-2.1 TaxID=3160833 RepID=UPI00386E4403
MNYYIVEGEIRNNIGDVLQGMVAEPFLPEPKKAVNRENLSSLPKTEPAFMIGNGWYMHHFESFPPPKNIIPFYLSVHIADSAMLRIERIRNHFKEHAPIGCRDQKTLKLFLGWGIPAYYSGCLTTTTCARKAINNSNNGEVLLVDNVDHPVPDAVVEKLEQLTNSKLIRVSHDPEQTEGSFEDYVKAGKDQMERLLERYCDAKLIFTTKIHCTLPCLGMGANVVLIHPNPNDPRLETVNEFMETVSYESILKMSSFKRPKVDYVKLQERQHFLKNIVTKSVELRKNSVQFGETSYFQNLKRKSERKAKLYNRMMLLMFKLGLKRKDLQRIYGLK